MSLIEQLKRHEGFSGKVYKCSAGANTIGYGHNLDAKPLTPAQAEVLLLADIEDARRDLYLAFDHAMYMDEVRRNVLINMTFNLGITRLMQFKKMLRYCERGEYPQSAVEMLDSAWAKQVGRRATELSEQMRTGKYIGGRV